MTAIVLAGGKSSRMGRDKSAVLLNGEPLLARSVRVLTELFDEVIVVTNREIPFALSGAKIIHDDIPYQGPLGGIYAGLKASSHDESFVAAVDMPFASLQVIDYLAGFIHEVDAVVPVTASGLEPLFAFYSKRCLPAIERTLAEGEKKVLSMLTRIDMKVIGYGSISHLEGADRIFININTERDLENAGRLEHVDGSAGTGDVDRGIDLGGVRIPPIERAATIYVNAEELVTIQTSMEHLDELACGFLVSEGILQARDELADIRINDETGEIRVRTGKPKTIASRAMGKRFITSGCGKGFSFINPGDALGAGRINSSFITTADEIRKLMKEFLKTSGRSGMHSAAFIQDSEIRFMRQDIGRHNTVDMIIGKLWLDEVEDRDGILMTTGRMSYEMVVKATKARIPVLVSRTAATDMAIKLANRLGIELVGYVRGSNMQVYTDGRRLERSY